MGWAKGLGHVGKNGSDGGAVDDRTKLMLVWPVAGFAVAAAFGIGLISMAAFLTDDEAESSERSAAAVLDVELGDLFLQPSALQAQPGPLTIRVHNEGQAEHNFAIRDVASTAMVAPGQTATLRVPSIEAGTYEILCEVPGHADAGMRGTLAVGEATAGSTGSASQMPAMSPEEMAAHDAEVTGSFPAETEGLGGQDLEARVTANGVKVFEVTAEAVRWETEPGVLKDAWAYNGTVPGPTIRADLGDRVRVVLHNELPEPTTIHFHGLTVPADMDGVPVISQDAVLPGESFTYEFTVRDTGTHMYHSHFNAQKQVPMGLLGAFIVPDPADPPVDADVDMVLNDGPLGFTLNGKGFPATQPVVVERGQTVRIRYMNEGLQIHPMHLHGVTQQVIAVDGRILDRPYVEDTVLVAPGQRVDVLVRATEPGAWAWHCHVLSHAESEQGMFGMVTAMIVEEP
jgi:FtsP/CotA-like multicopper oxidase with cupredoxin domain